MNFFRKQVADKVIFLCDVVFGVAQRGVDELDGLFERVLVAAFFRNDFFSVPLVNKN